MVKSGVIAMLRLELYRDVIVSYRKWLDAQRPAACARFLQRLDNSDPIHVEGAIGEASAWNWLEPRCDLIELNESEHAGGPDFRCASDGSDFFVETTTITIPVATDRTGLDHSGIDRGPKFYGTATRAIKQEILGKSKQVAGHNKPVLIFVTTLHWEVSAIGLQSHHLEELLIGSSVITARLNRFTGDSVGPTTNEATFDHPVFFESGTCHPLRRHISGVLIGGFGLVPPACTVRGVLHPDPVRVFNPRCLLAACFGSLKPWPLSAGSRVIWQRHDGELCDDEAERQQTLEAARRNLHAEGLLEGIQSELRKRNDDPHH